MNPYDILGVNEHVTEEELRRVFLEHAKELHPDTARTEEERKEKEEKFKKITYAYNLLKNYHKTEVSRYHNDNKGKSKESDKIFIRKAHEFIFKGDYNSALESLRHVKNQETYEVNMLKGLALFKKKKYHESIKFYKKAAELNPWDAEVYSCLGDVYSCVQLEKTAEMFYKKALEIDSNNKKALNGLEKANRRSSSFSFFKTILKGKN